jgi:hypothetical protein
MNENMDESEETTDVTDAARWVDQDELLAGFVGITNAIASAGAQQEVEVSLEADITLAVGGLLVSGRLISAQQYLAGLKDQFKQMQHDNKVATMVREELVRFIDNIAQPYNDPEDKRRVGFIHLRDVTFLSPNRSPVVAPQSFWRARLTSVDGFMLGRFA